MENPKIALIQGSKFNPLDYPEEARIAFTDIYHRGTLYKQLIAFEQYITGFPFDYIFDSPEQLNEWFVFVPQSITPRQGMLLLSRRGQLSMVEQVIYNLESIIGDKQLAEEAIIEWDKASSWDRQNNTVQFVADLLMWNEDDKDDFFVEADKIK